MKKLDNLDGNSLNLNEMSIFNGGYTGNTDGNKIDGASYVCDYNQPDGSGTIYYPDESEWNPYKTN